jgi:small subunit ribosomal protein S16e
VRPEILAHKAFEPVLIIGRQHLKNLDIRLRVKGGGQVSQIYGA